MLDAGVRVIQYREKTKKMGAKYAECLILREMAREADAAFIVNDDIDLALLVDADGVHVGQEDLPVAAVRKLVGDGMAIGLSTHSPRQARAAVEAGADYIGVGPIFATQTKDDVCAPVGLPYLDFVAREIALPFVAIGGIKEHNLAEVAAHGARCAALVTEIVGAPDIAATIATLRRIIDAPRA
jgi:thiamine-phosphate pyrophosphorylase